MRAIILAAILCACAQSPPSPANFVEPPDPRAWIGDATLSPQGLGHIEIGKSIAPVQAALDYWLTQAEPSENSPGCGEYGIEFDTTAGIGIQTQDGIVTRVSIDGPSGIRTAEGIAVGDTAVQVRAAYSNAERRSAEYVPAPGHELFVWTQPDAHIGLRFEIGEDERVTAIHAGTDLSNDEGCATA
jgi:hypothetical protein